MATIALMIGGAVLNATSFIGGSYLAKYLTGNNIDEERKRHDKAIEKYQYDYEIYEENRQKLIDWQTERYKNQQIASSNMRSTDDALKLYNEAHQQKMQLQEPQFSNYYKPSSTQKKYEMAYVGGGMLAVGYVASKFL